MPTTLASIPTTQVVGAQNQNPPFDPRIYRYPVLATMDGRGIPDPKVNRGYIVTANPAPGAGQYAVRFLRNPGAVSLDHQIDPDIVSQAGKRPPGVNDGQLVAASTGSTVGFDLYFDRTFEVWDGDQQGVYGDMLAFYNLLGMTVDPGAPTDVAAGDSTTTQTLTIPNNAPPVGQFITSPMRYTPVYLTFGGQNGGPLRFYGIITHFTVTIGHWSLNMIPSRASIHVDFTILPGGAATIGGAPGAASGLAAPTTGAANPASAQRAS